MLKIWNYLGGIKYINDNMTVASIAEKMHILNKCLKCIYITLLKIIFRKESLLAARNKSAKELPKNWAKVRM